MDEEGNISKRNKKTLADSLGSDKEIPIGIKVWTIDPRFGDRIMAAPDTLSHGFMNTIFTTGKYGEYNATGNLGAPRISRIFIDRPTSTDQFIFTQPYEGFFITPVEKFHFTNTLSPFTNLTYHTAGDKTNGEDRLKALFGVNAGKRIGLGFKFDYMYGRGYYSNQNTSLFDYTMYGSYLGERYQAHLLMSTNHQKVAENGGITNDLYITNPEHFDDDFNTDEIPTVLEKNWNRNDNQHIYFNHRYSLGFRRKVKMTEEEIKARKFAMASEKENAEKKAHQEAANKARQQGRDTDAKGKKKEVVTYGGRPKDAKIAGVEPTADGKKNERIAISDNAMADSLLAKEEKAKEDTSWLKTEYVPVTSFIHTVRFDNYRRIYQAYETPENYYADTYNTFSKFGGDSIYDKTRHYRLQNTFAISLLEGFNKWAKAGLKGFITHELRNFNLPDSVGGTASYKENNISIGAQISKTQGSMLHFNATAETWLTGEDAGQFRIDATADLNFRLFGDTVTLAANGFIHRDNPSFYYRHFHAKHYWWDNSSMDAIYHTRLEGLFLYQKTKTTLRFAFDELKNYAYFSNSYDITNSGDSYGRSNNRVNVNQSSSAITLLTASISQDVKLGPLNWETILTYQKSTKQDVIPVPDFNVYTNLYLRFKIAHVLKCEFGGDMRYFTKYAAPDYVPGIGMYAVQGNETKTEVGNYPLINVYANFHLKHTRFFIMMSHVNSGMGDKNYFFTPHYVLNDRILRFGLSWNFFN
ncbi:MAG: putative porin [Prevotella sp.]|nr:putative porin [Prevotella sp.]